MGKYEPGVFSYPKRPEITGEGRVRTAEDFRHEDDFVPIIDRSATLDGTRKPLEIKSVDGETLWKGDGFGSIADALSKGKIPWRDADLSRARIGAIVARNRDLTGVSLRGAEIEGADLSEINLTGADLREATFRNCVLTRANLKNAQIEGATFEGCQLHGVEVGGSDLKRDQLTNCKGLILKD